MGSLDSPLVDLSDLLSVSRHRVYDLELAIDLTINKYFEPQRSARYCDITIPKFFDAIDLSLMNLDVRLLAFDMSDIITALELLLTLRNQVYQDLPGLVNQ